MTAKFYDNLTKLFATVNIDVEFTNIEGYDNLTLFRAYDEQGDLINVVVIDDEKDFEIIG